MEANSSTVPTTYTSAIPPPTASAAVLIVPNPNGVPVPHANSAIAFMIGLSIILLASILNAAGLNLTKLDHVRTSQIPKSARRRDWLRPLWLLGMVLYILSQLIGSTLALEYMRAEYVAPLGSSSLVFNFLFARFLVGTPVTSTDIYGTIVVVLGVVGIVAFGSINAGLATETDVAHLTYLWRRGGWLGFFFFMVFALSSLLLFTSRLDFALSARGENDQIPFTPTVPNRNSSPPLSAGSGGHRRSVFKVVRGIGYVASGLISGIDRLLEIWAGPKDDKTVAWTLGIGWACCGGGLAGGTLVFAKATVKLVSGSLSHENTGNQFGHAAPIFTFILLAITAVMQIICLNRGLKVYDSTLVVPVFYGVYTALGFLDSLIFNNEVDAYHSWTLFLIFTSILVLISGVVLLTHKKPETTSTPTSAAAGTPRRGRRARKSKPKSSGLGPEGDALRSAEEGGPEEETFWAVGDASDDDDDSDGEDEDVDHHQHPLSKIRGGPSGSSRHTIDGDEQTVGLLGGEGDETPLEPEMRRSSTSLPLEPFRDSEDLEPWAGIGNTNRQPI